MNKSILSLYGEYFGTMDYKFIKLHIESQKKKDSWNQAYGFYESEHLPGTKFILFKMLSGQNPPLNEEKEKLIEVVSSYLQNGK